MALLQPPADLLFSFGIVMLLCLAAVLLFSLLAQRLDEKTRKSGNPGGNRVKRRKRGR